MFPATHMIHQLSSSSNPTNGPGWIQKLLLLVEGLDLLLLSCATGNSTRTMNDELSASRRYCTVPLIVFTSFWLMCRPRPSRDTPGPWRNISCISASGTPGAGWTSLQGSIHGLNSCYFQGDSAYPANRFQIAFS